MEEFYERIDTMLESLLNKPVLAELYNENDQLIKKLELKKVQFNFSFDVVPQVVGLEIIAKFLQIQGYSDPIEGPNYVLQATIGDKTQTFKIKTDIEFSDSDNIIIEWNDVKTFEGDYYVHLIPGKRYAGFIKLEKLIDIISKGNIQEDNLFKLPFTDFQKQFKIVSI